MPLMLRPAGLLQTVAGWRGAVRSTEARRQMRIAWCDACRVGMVRRCSDGCVLLSCGNQAAQRGQDDYPRVVVFRLKQKNYSVFITLL